MSIYCKNNLYTLYLGKMQEELDNLEDNSVDSIVTDPPYELNFMNKGWDNSGVAFQKDTWEKCLRVLKPGGHLLAFGGSRTYHRIACAIEDAGFEIRDTIMWIYGSGFPKSMNIANALEAKVKTGSANKKDFKKLDGVKGVTQLGYTKMYKEQGARPDDYNGRETTIKVDITTDLAKKWVGWGSCLKPAYEPIVVARKPFDGSLVDNIIEYGVGGLNIDECRVETSGELVDNHKTAGTPFMRNAEDYQQLDRSKSDIGRFPANIITDGSDEVAEGFPNTKSNGGPTTMPDFKDAGKKNSQNKVGYNDGETAERLESGYTSIADEGSAMRYFYVAKESNKDEDNIPQTVGRFPSNVILDGSEEVTGGFPVRETQNGSITKRYKMNNQVYGEYGYCNTWDAYQDSGSASRYYYCAKASKKDRDEGLDEMPNTYSAVSNQAQAEFKRGNNEFADQNNSSFNKVYVGKNTHPTVKPTELMQYLVRLVSPKGATILDPFMGSGSTGKACMIENTERNANYKFIGIEMTEEYLPIADARIRYWVDREIEEEVKEDVEPVKKEDVVKLW